jgi:hypothetical protein
METSQPINIPVTASSHKCSSHEALSGWLLVKIYPPSLNFPSFSLEPCPIWNVYISYLFPNFCWMVSKIGVLYKFISVSLANSFRNAIRIRYLFCDVLQNKSLLVGLRQIDRQTFSQYQ